eukprot:CAMPEP_0176408394 /NCGR_PEP_ID=MMETSP0127-20121128/1929_1 /TAXON_ID=938130 /ORGANISM="Platyophrya macrostoma, Strain WH" /LENGTH=221 /DNA_ID=CAMNT_0017787679 /DNA_START=299 /DNA_END=964 /DNA_ORIENTATION=-
MSKQSLNARLKVQNASTHTGTFTAVDTASGAIRNHNMQVWTQRTDKGDNSPSTFHFRYLSDSLCDHPLPFSLDVNHNVDLDAIGFKKESTLVNGTRLFIRESTLHTSLVRSIATVHQLITVLPGAQEMHLNSGTELVVTHEAQYRVVCNTPVLSNRGVTSMQLVLEEWTPETPALQKYWKLTLRTSNPMQETLMTKLWINLREEFSSDVVSDASIGLVSEF